MNYKEQLLAIQKAAGWSQEQLAARLDVTFVTLNSWINERSQPRQKALQNIERLYLEIVGANTVSATELQAAKQAALKLKSNIRTIVKDKGKLEALTLYLTYHTNTIEGSTMTLSDVEDVIFEHKVLSNRTAIEQAEARNHQATLYWLLDELVNKSKDFAMDESLILGIHLRLMNGIISDAGQYRKHSVRIMGSHVALANWAKVPDLIRNLTANLQSPSNDIIKILADTHARFEQIHPFSDGNGRTGRLIMLAQALAVGIVPPLVVKERKHAYYKYLEAAQTMDNLSPLELFIAQSMQFTDELLKKN
jgi:Fic family protein/DNA-binding XRE family transcriptional regulator